ncbi:MAG: iron export ABC transporter permease subunit FetB [Proteobacteria bacterium]|nr:iron export ABC transporter permease subunit FetB [Pseudomonadota bacterium]
MGVEIIAIGPWQLALGLIFILAAGLTSLYHGLGLERDLLVGTVRTFVQLFLLGYVLTLIFGLNRADLVLAAFGLMVLFAALTIRGRIKEKRISFFWPVFFSMLVSYGLVSVMVTGVIVGVRPWWTPQYYIPLAGMVIGNSMNAIAIALERLLGELRSKRPQIEMMLSLGANRKEASREAVGTAMRAGMIPSINSMMAVGVVFIPGMMTGQILAGADPLAAIRYQIVVMIMLVGSTAVGSLLVVLLVRRRCFGPADRLLPRPK